MIFENLANYTSPTIAQRFATFLRYISSFLYFMGKKLIAIGIYVRGDILEDDDEETEERTISYSKIGDPRGLRNVGNTGYANTAFQALVDLQRLSGIEKNPKAGPVTKAFGSLCTAYWGNWQNTLTADTIRLAVAKSFDSTYDNTEQHDSMAFVSCVLHAMHEELNEADVETFNYMPKLLARKGETLESMIQRQWRYFKSRKSSIISRNFYGMMIEVVQCQRCNLYDFDACTFQPTMFINVQPRKEDMGLPGLNLIDLLLRETHNIKSQAAGKCSKSECGGDLFRLKGFNKWPKYLIVELKRGSKVEKLQSPVSFTERIRVVNFPDTGFVEYRLCTVINHFDNSSSGRCTVNSYRIDARGMDQWYHVSDLNTFSSPFNTISNSEISKSAYGFVYKRADVD